MKLLLAMLGAPASGKDYFIKKHNLEDYVISADIIRKQFGLTNLTVVDNELVDDIQSKNENKIWKNLEMLLKQRMINGATTVLNNTNLSKSSFSDIDKYCQKYS